MSLCMIFFYARLDDLIDMLLVMNYQQVIASLISLRLYNLTILRSITI